MPTAPQPFFMPVEDGRGGQRFCLFHAAQGQTACGSVLYIHPFAEEMNKSRRMAALQSRALAQAGYEVLQIDLLGCGDSSGDFGDATWQEWISDVVRGCDWLRSRPKAQGIAPSDPPPLWLWGLRAGCLLAVEAASQLNEPCNFLFWQPATAGKLVLQQFLRLKLASDMLSGSSKGLMDAMRQQLAQDQSLEIAGYTLAKALASGLEQSQLTPHHAAPECRVEWIEITSKEDATLSPVALQAQAQWTAASYRLSNHGVQGPSFWQTTEIEDAPNLIAASTAALLANDSESAAQGTRV